MDSIPGLKAYAPRLNGFARLSSDQRTDVARVVAIDDEAEASGYRLKFIIRDGEYLSPDDGPQA
ncbi:hypothetical protein, partial [Oceanidesulfovibrio marinus]